MILINQTQWNRNIKKVLQTHKKKLEPELKSKFEESIAGKTKLRKQRLKKIAKKEKTTDKICIKNTLSIQAQVTCTKI